MTLYVIARPIDGSPREDYRNISRITIKGKYVYLNPMVGSEIRLSTHVVEIEILRSLDK